jgi:hypothetical protein
MSMDIRLFGIPNINAYRVYTMTRSVKRPDYQTYPVSQLIWYDHRPEHRGWGL